MFFCVSPSQLAIDYNNIQVTDTRTKNRGHIQGGGDKMLYLLLSISFHFRFLFFFNNFQFVPFPSILFWFSHFLSLVLFLFSSFSFFNPFCFCFPRLLSSTLFSSPSILFHFPVSISLFPLSLSFFLSISFFKPFLILQKNDPLKTPPQRYK